MAYLPLTPPISDQESPLTLSGSLLHSPLTPFSDSDMESPTKKRKVQVQVTEMEDIEDDQALKARVDSLSPMLCWPTPTSTEGAAPEVDLPCTNASQRRYTGTLGLLSE